MADQIYFSRDTRCFIQFRNSGDNNTTSTNLGKGGFWEIPILDGYSFSQTTNTSEITLAEMESTAGISRRGRRMFTDSLAPAEWSFSTYVRPFKAKGNNAVVGTGKTHGTAGVDVHAVEEVLWAHMAGADTYNDSTSYNFKRTTNPKATNGPVLTSTTAVSELVFTESNRSALNSMTIFFLIETKEGEPLVYKLPEAVVNDVSIDFDVDGIATLAWSGFAKEVKDWSGRFLAGTDAAPASNATMKDGNAIDYGDLYMKTDNPLGRAVHIVANKDTGTPSNAATVTQAIDEATTSTANFIRNRLTSVTIEAKTDTDKVPSIFPGSHAVISGANTTTDVITTSSAHGLTTGDTVYITGVSGTTEMNHSGTNTHKFVGVASTTTFKLYDTLAHANSNGSTGRKDLTNAFSGSGGTVANGKYKLTLTGGSFNVANNITYLVPEELGAINKPLEHVTGTRAASGTATCYLTLDSDDRTNGTSRQFFNDLVSDGAMGKVVNKFKVTMDIGGSTAATSGSDEPAIQVIFPQAHIEVPTHQVEDVISLETSFQALPDDFGDVDEIEKITFFPIGVY